MAGQNLLDGRTSDVYILPDNAGSRFAPSADTKVVTRNDAMPALDQEPGYRGANQPGGARDEDVLTLQACRSG